MRGNPGASPPRGIGLDEAAWPGRGIPTLGRGFSGRDIPGRALKWKEEGVHASKSWQRHRFQRHRGLRMWVAMKAGGGGVLHLRVGWERRSWAEWGWGGRSGLSRLAVVSRLSHPQLPSRIVVASEYDGCARVGQLACWGARDAVCVSIPGLRLTLHKPPPRWSRWAELSFGPPVACAEDVRLRVSLHGAAPAATCGGGMSQRPLPLY